MRRALALMAMLVTAVPAGTRAAEQDILLPQVPPGFAVSVFAAVGSPSSSLDFGPDGRLYVADYNGGRVVVYEDLGGVAGPPATFAEGFTNPLGVMVAADGAVYVADTEPRREGPFGNRVYGRVSRVVDSDGDGIGDRQNVVLTDLPNGRHNTNGMALGPDGLLYVSNGNSTDDGVEGGDPEVQPWSGSVVRVDPDAKAVSLARLGRKALVATGMRNLYDVAFSPYRRGDLFIPMNGTDDATEGSTGEDPTQPLEDSDDLLYLTAALDRRADDFGFPSCLYNIERTEGELRPYDSPNGQVIERFGRCPRNVPRPVSSFGLHVSADGLAFQTTDAWGADYENDLFVAEFGNFFGAEVVGHDVVRVELDDKGRRVTGQSQFMVGAVPLDVTFDDDGALYVLDFSGVIFRVVQVVDLPTTSTMAPCTTPSYLC